MSTHTAIAATSKGVISAIQVPTPVPGPSDVLVKIEYSSLITFDTWITDLGFYVQSYPATLGFNAVGKVVKTGENVDGIKVGDAIATWAIGSGRKALQQYGVFAANLCAKIPKSLDLPSAATIPDNFVSAYFTLFDQLGLPIPDELPATTPPPNADTPILIYGSGSTTGMYEVQLLKLAGYTNILTTASKQHHAYLSSLGAAHNFDYASPTLAEDVQSTVGGRVPLVVDNIATIKTLNAISKFVAPDGRVAILVPVKDSERLTGGELLLTLPDERSEFASGVKLVYVGAFGFQANDFMRDNLLTKILPKLLEAGNLQPSKVLLLDNTHGDLKARTEFGLNKLRTGEIRGEKVVVKIDH